MKKNIYLWILLMGNIAFAQAQLVSVAKRTTMESAKPAYYPVFNADGSELLYTADNYNGLYLYDLDRKSIRTITDAEGAGFAPDFSRDAKKIYYRTTNRSAANRRAQTSLNCYDRVQTRTTVCTETSARQTSVKAYTDRLQLMLDVNGKCTALEPLPKGSRYIWGSLSPDKSRILFTASGKGTYTCDLNGKNIIEIGYLNAPVWYDDHKIVGMVDKDNGERVTESAVVMVSTDGKTRQVLSPFTEIAMYPAASAQGGKIAYNTVEGEIIILELKK